MYFSKFLRHFFVGVILFIWNWTSLAQGAKTLTLESIGKN